MSIVFIERVTAIVVIVGLGLAGNASDEMPMQATCAVGVCIAFINLFKATT